MMSAASSPETSVAHSAVTILGAGRMGQGLALALQHTGRTVHLVSRTIHPLVGPLHLHPGSRSDAVRAAEVLLLAVPDGAIGPLAAELAGEAAVDSRHAVLHLSGRLDRGVLAPLESTGAALGSFHPLQTIADPASAPERLRRAYAGIEGDERALASARALAEAVGMMPVTIPGHAKAAYHAGAAFAANYTTVLAAVAERLARAAGVDPGLAGRIYLPLIRGAAANLEAGPAAALTGPVRRGDAETVAAHLATLSADDRELYVLLAREALRLAREAGLAPGAAARVARELDAAPQG
jgi:predicted short-subunit dehydrogenase-like oxidoreductase (DUF2520 family)